MNKWYMVTVNGEDRRGIVAAISRALTDAGCNLGETSMARLGGNFTIMMMVSSAAEDGVSALEGLLRPVAEQQRLHLHVDAIHAHLHDHPEPDVQVRVFGADRAGIVAEVTGALAEAGLHILDLNSEVGGTADKPVYVMVIDGHAGQGIDALEASLEPVRASGIEVSLTPLDTLVG